MGASRKCTITHGPSKVDVPGVSLTEGLVHGLGVWFSGLWGAARPLDPPVIQTAYRIFLWVKEVMRKEMATWSSDEELVFLAEISASYKFSVGEKRIPGHY